MREIYETKKDNETIRLIRTVYNYDGIIDEAWKIEHVYHFDYGRTHIVGSYTNRIGAYDLIERYNLTPVKQGVAYADILCCLFTASLFALYYRLVLSHMLLDWLTGQIKI